MKILAILLVFVILGCARSGTNTIAITGSDTMVNLVTRWAEVYMQKNPDVRIQVSGGGSGNGIAHLVQATVDIANCSRELTQEEINHIKKQRGKEPTVISVALDCVTFYVNRENPIEELSIPQLKDIFTGKITNWSQLGWKNAKIIVYSRDSASGTHMFVRAYVLEDESFGNDTQYLPGTAAIVNAVAKDRYGIGYGGVGYIAEGVKFIKVKRKEGMDAYEPSEENAISGRYPLTRDLYMVVVGKPKGAMRDFIRWIKGKEAQKICKQVGFYAKYKY
jgi:phosphate transport system substrate-binding protein